MRTIPMIGCLVGSLVGGCALDDLDGLSDTEAELSSTKLVDTTLAGTGAWHTIVRLPPIQMAAGAKQYLTGSWQPRSNTTAKILQGLAITCSLDGTSMGRSPWSNTNHHGTTEPLYSGARWLFTAPRAGSYTCELKGRACSIPSCIDPARELQVASTEIHALNATPASASDVIWAEAAPRCIAPGATEKVMPRWWVAGSNARVVDVDLDLEVTTVIDSPAWIDPFCEGLYQDDRGTTATGRLVAVQLDPANRPCAPVYQTSARQLFISADTHHDKLHLSLRDVPISTSLRCTRKFSIYGVVSGSGSTLYLQLPDYSAGIARSR